MKSLVDEFLNYLVIERGLSKNTISSYGTDLRHFASYLESIGITDPDSVKRQDIMDYLLKLKDSKISSNSISRALVAIKMFYKFLVRERLARDDVAGLNDPDFVPDANVELANVIPVAQGRGGNGCAADLN